MLKDARAECIGLWPNLKSNSRCPSLDAVQSAIIPIVFGRVGVRRCLPIVAHQQLITQHAYIPQREREPLRPSRVACCRSVANERHPVGVRMINPGVGALELRQEAGDLDMFEPFLRHSGFDAGSDEIGVMC